MIKSHGVDPAHPPAGASAAGPASRPGIRFWVHFMGPDAHRGMDGCPLLQLKGQCLAMEKKKEYCSLKQGRAVGAWRREGSFCTPRFFPPFPAAHAGLDPGLRVGFGVLLPASASPSGALFATLPDEPAGWKGVAALPAPVCSTGTRRG